MTKAVSLSGRAIWLNFLLYPAHTLPTAAAPVAVGIGLAVRNGVFAAEPVLIAFLASWLVHLGGIFLDNYKLIFDHPEVPEHPELLQSLADGTLTRRMLQRAIAASFIAAVAVGVWLLPIAGVLTVVLGAVGIAASAGYAAGPYPLVRLGIAEPVFVVMFGIVAVVGTYYVQAVASLGATPHWLPVPGALPVDAFLLGLPEGALVTSVLVIDDLRDSAFDAVKGWHTGTVRFGRSWGRTQFTGLVVFGYLCPFWFWLELHFSAWVLLPLLTLPAAAFVTHRVCTRNCRTDLIPMTPCMAFVSLAYSILLGIGIAVS